MWIYRPLCINTAAFPYLVMLSSLAAHGGACGPGGEGGGQLAAA